MLSSISPDAPIPAPAPGEDFRIIIALAPVDGLPQPPRGTAVCAPAAPLGVGTTGEGVPAYATKGRRSALVLSPTDIDLLARGRLLSALELERQAHEIFVDREARLDQLARNLLACEALADYLEPLAVALAAPDTPAAALPAERRAQLAGLVRSFAIPQSERGQEADRTLARLSELVEACNAEEFLARARDLYPQQQALLEDVYLVRALSERPAEALELISMRRYLSEALVPPSDTELALDRAIVQEQLHFAALVAEPKRLSAARAALEHFQARYRERYVEHHRSYWSAMARIHARLSQAQSQTQALTRLNSLIELGPPAGEGALVAYQQMLEQTSSCPLILGIEEELPSSPVCPACHLRLDQEPPAEHADEILRRLERAINRHLIRLSSAAVAQVLRHSGDPRVEKFLQVVQASQIASLPEVLDDELTGYVRRFLVESRINAALQPLLAQIQQGGTPKAEDAHEAMREVSRLLDRAFRAVQRALPQPVEATTARIAKRKR